MRMGEAGDARARGLVLTEETARDLAGAAPGVLQGREVEGGAGRPPPPPGIGGTRCGCQRRS